MVENKNLKIFHLKQRHKADGISSESKELTIHSQYNIAKYISLHNKIAVVSEGLSEDHDCFTSIVAVAVCYLTRIFFWNGLPQKYKELNDIQKDIIYDYGAPYLLLNLGIIPKIYRSIDKHNGDIANEKFDQLSLREFLTIFKNDSNWDNRETLAIENSIRAAEQHYGNNHNNNGVFLVFGGDHDFTSECHDQGVTLGIISFDEPKKELSEEYISKVNNLLSTFIYDDHL